MSSQRAMSIHRRCEGICWSTVANARWKSAIARIATSSTTRMKMVGTMVSWFVFQCMCNCSTWIGDLHNKIHYARPQRRYDVWQVQTHLWFLLRLRLLVWSMTRWLNYAERWAWPSSQFCFWNANESADSCRTFNDNVTREREKLSSN